LTHYGANYGLMPAGIGPKAMEWAAANDQRLLRLICELKAGQIVDEARSHQNACGAGAIAAMLTACLEMGAKTARVLRHTSSYHTLQPIQPQSGDMAVGYAAAVVQ
jgi:MEMO1 family protein